MIDWVINFFAWPRVKKDDTTAIKIIEAALN